MFISKFSSLKFWFFCVLCAIFVEKAILQSSEFLEEVERLLRDLKLGFQSTSLGVFVKLILLKEYFYDEKSLIWDLLCARNLVLLV